MACNNTTYIQMVTNNTDMRMFFFRHAFFVENMNHNVPVAMLINKCVTPVWIVIGTFGNIVSALVWASPRIRTCNTVAYYLTSLALADLTFLVLHLIYELQNPWLLGSLDFHGWCQVFSMSNIAVQYFCVFLVFAFTVERFLSICYPFKSERFSKTRTPRIIFALFALSIILSAPQSYFWVITRVDECQSRPLEEDVFYAAFYSIYTWCTELMVFLVLPLVVLFLNLVVVHKIRSVGSLQIGKANSFKYDARCPPTASPTNLLAVNVDQANGSKRFSRTSGGMGGSSKGPTVTLLWVSFYLIATVLPNTIVYAMQPLVHYGSLPCSFEDMPKDPTWRAYFNFMAVKLVVKEISMSHHVGNVFIYMATSRQFLRLAWQNLCPKTKGCRGESKDNFNTIRIMNTNTVGVDI